MESTISIITLRETARTVVAAVLITVLLGGFLLCGNAQDQPQETQRDNIKRKLEFERWAEILEETPEVRYGPFQMEEGELEAWNIVRVQKLGQANRGEATQYLLAKQADPREGGEVVRLTITRCPTQAEAMEGLVDVLTGLQRPDLQLIRNPEEVIGQLRVGFKGPPPAGIYFLRGNIIVSIENAGTVPATGLSDLARKVDGSIKAMKPNE